MLSYLVVLWLVSALASACIQFTYGQRRFSSIADEQMASDRVFSIIYAMTGGPVALAWLCVILFLLGRCYGSFFGGRPMLHPLMRAATVRKLRHAGFVVVVNWAMVVLAAVLLYGAAHLAFDGKWVAALVDLALVLAYGSSASLRPGTCDTRRMWTGRP